MNAPATPDCPTPEALLRVRLSATTAAECDTVLAHVARCPACKAAYTATETLHPALLRDAQAAAVWDTHGAVATLAEPLRVSRAGRRVSAAGMDALIRRSDHEYGARMSGDGDPAEIDWDVPLPEWGGRVRVRVGFDDASGAWSLGCELAATGATAARVEVGRPDGLDVWTGAAEEFPPGGVRLGPGDWVVRLSCAAGVRAIPITLG